MIIRQLETLHWEVLSPSRFRLIGVAPIIVEYLGRGRWRHHWEATPHQYGPYPSRAAAMIAVREFFERREAKRKAR